MTMLINYTPLRDALALAGQDVEGRFLYQDYLHQVAGTGLSPNAAPPMSEHQWEVMCDIIRADRPLYASNVKSMLANMKAKAKRAEAE